MWSFLVLFFGAFLYGAWAMWNASLLPHPAQVRGERKAEHMAVYHAAAKRKCAGPASPCAVGQEVTMASADLPGGFQPPSPWESKMIAGDNNRKWLVTYALNPVEDRDQFAWALAKYDNGNSLLVGQWSNNDCTKTAAAPGEDKPCIKQMMPQS